MKIEKFQSFNENKSDLFEIGSTISDILENEGITVVKFEEVTGMSVGDQSWSRGIKMIILLDNETKSNNFIDSMIDDQDGHPIQLNIMPCHFNDPIIKRISNLCNMYLTDIDFHIGLESHPNQRLIPTYLFLYFGYIEK